MKKYGMFAGIVILAVGLHLLQDRFEEMDAMVSSWATDGLAFCEGIGSGPKQTIEATTILLVKSDANGGNGEDDDEKDKEGDDADGFDRLWDVVLYG